MSSVYDRLPLVPIEFSSLSEALQNFIVVFESRYGGFHPRFQPMSLSDALADAFDSSRSSIMERKPMAIYLHNDEAVACNIFAQNVLCSEAICSLLNCQFVCWPWDMTQADNRTKFYKWLDESNMFDVKDAIKMTSLEEYPLLVLITKDRSTINVAGIAHGPDNAGSVMEKIIFCLDQFQMIKNKEMVEERSRLEREQIRQEQVTEYERSKAIDRAKQEELQRQRQLEIDEQKRQVEEEEEKQRRQAELASKMPVEPEASDTDAITIRLRFPNGEQRIRRFRMSETLDWLVCFVESLGYDMKGHRLWTSDIPRKDVSSLDTNKSFSQVGWTRREQITVEEK